MIAAQLDEKMCAMARNGVVACGCARKTAPLELGHGQCMG
jgi:hypothetical protein